MIRTALAIIEQLLKELTLNMGAKLVYDSSLPIEDCYLLTGYITKQPHIPNIKNMATLPLDGTILNNLFSNIKFDDKYTNRINYSRFIMKIHKLKERNQDYRIYVDNYNSYMSVALMSCEHSFELLNKQKRYNFYY